MPYLSAASAAAEGAKTTKSGEQRSRLMTHNNQKTYPDIDKVLAATRPRLIVGDSKVVVMGRGCHREPRTSSTPKRNYSCGRSWLSEHAESGSAAKQSKFPQAAATSEKCMYLMCATRAFVLCPERERERESALEAGTVQLEEWWFTRKSTHTASRHKINITAF